MSARWTIAFDADDTLWENEQFFQATKTDFTELLSDYVEPDHLDQRLTAAEMRNLARYGYGIKGFTLSMIETAIEVTESRVPTQTIAEVLRMGREMLDHPIELLPHVKDCLESLGSEPDIILITKGDLLHQEQKLAQSGLGDYFDAVEIVSEKTPEIYQRIFARRDRPRAMMVGNSMRSDVLPAIAAGAWGTYVPHDLTWDHERAEAPANTARFHEIAHLGELAPLIASL
ncbi:MAG TPA: HAD family hydrolase [Paracoccaceae bacterium]|nr:HAD family hydrolase [Paracoccaceae bacterium]